jgi:hypothetical protein
MKHLSACLLAVAFLASAFESPLFAQSRLTSNGQYSGQYSGRYSGQYSGVYSGRSVGQYAGGNAATQAGIERLRPPPVSSGSCGELFPTAPGTDFLLQDSQGHRC